MRDILLNNFWWKVTALILAMLAWYGFSPEEQQPKIFPTSAVDAQRLLIAHPVTISKPATDRREVKVTPAEVDITLSGDDKVLRGLAADEIRAEVLLTELRGESNKMVIHVVVPPRVKVERRTPETVQVEVLKE